MVPGVCKREKDYVKSKIQVKQKVSLHSEIKCEVIKVKEKFCFYNYAADYSWKKKLCLSF